jgi:pimeloyl-ACP methyl ester carboxylesterase
MADVTSPTAGLLEPTGVAEFESLRSFEDRRGAFRERFLTPDLSGVRTVAVLSTPLGRARSHGWVLCPPFGAQQANLTTVEVACCRALAAAGFPVLRYHPRGYGDSQASAADVTLGSQVQDAVDAARLLAASADVASVGFFGALLGGAVAALAAEELAEARPPSSALALWEPVVCGRSYMRTLTRLGMMTQLVSEGRTASDDDPVKRLRAEGVLEVQGFPLNERTYDEVSALDLRKTLGVFRGISLVVQISKTDRPRGELTALAERLTALGGEAHLEVLQDAHANEFGGHRFRGVGNGTKIDILSTLAGALVDTTMRWCATAFEAAS